ncbi:hypothetical protein TWF696_001055 [Orbilia brochopaga]|uniref:Uncharacterized protein n=1 Tax=Orbilia brochopaga TaxID=3140254 RepID=A0AAV9VFS0_9PEZI
MRSRIRKAAKRKRLKQAKSLCNAAHGFEKGCLYHFGALHQLPKFRIVEHNGVSWQSPSDISLAVCDSFGGGVFIEAWGLQGTCSPKCRCKQIGHWRRLLDTDFAFVVSMPRHIIRSDINFPVIVHDKLLQDTVVDTVGSRPDIYHLDTGLPVACWDSDYLLSQYNALKMRLQAIMHDSNDVERFLLLRLLVDGFLQYLLPTDSKVMRSRDASDVLSDVMLLEEQGENTSNKQQVKFCKARHEELLAATKAQHWKDVLQLLDAEPGTINTCDAQGATPLFYAASAGHLDVVRELHARGADIDWLDDDGRTVLHKAVEEGHGDVARFLLDHGADINAQDNRGRTAAHAGAALLLNNGHQPGVSDVDDTMGMADDRGVLVGSSPALLAPPRPCDLVDCIPHDGTEHICPASYISELFGQNEPTQTTATKWCINCSNWKFLAKSGSRIPRFLRFMPLWPSIEYTYTRKLLENIGQPYPDFDSKEPGDWSEAIDLGECIQGRQVLAKKAVMRTFFKQEFYKVMSHRISHRVSRRFPNPARAWRHGMAALRRLSQGYTPRELGMAMALLCVCKAVSQTLDQYPDSVQHVDGTSYLQQFKNDLPRWSDLFHGRDRELFIAVAGEIWEVKDMASGRSRFDLDYHQLLKDVQNSISNIIDAAGRLFKMPQHGGQSLFPRAQSPPPPLSRPLPRKDPDPGPDPGDTNREPGPIQDPTIANDRPGLSHVLYTWVDMVDVILRIFNMILALLLWLNRLLTNDINSDSIYFYGLGFPTSVDGRTAVATIQSDPGLVLDVPFSLLDTSSTGFTNQAAHQPSIDAQRDTAMSEQDHGSNSSSQTLATPSSISRSTIESHRSSRRAAKKRTTSTQRYPCKEPGRTKDYSRREYAERHYMDYHAGLKPCKSCKKNYHRRYFDGHICNPNKPLVRNRAIS